MRTQAEMRQTPMIEPRRTVVIMEQSDFDRLTIAAKKENTTASEIVRTVVREWLNTHGYEFAAIDRRVFYRIYYGIKAFNSDGTERAGNNEMCTGALYTRLDTAIQNQKFWFDGMCEEMRRHNPRRRKSEQAFCYIQAVTGITDDDETGVDAYDLLKDDQKKKLDAAHLVKAGTDF